MENYIKSPLNYIGGKTKLLSQLIPLFPSKISSFVEPFCGGYNVGINVNWAKCFIAIDVNKYLIDLLNYLKVNDFEIVSTNVHNLIQKYNLSLLNVDGYNLLRSDYNKTKDPLLLFVLVCFSFNHQIRFNNSLNFNTPFGKNRSEYNASIAHNLKCFCEKLVKQNITFLSGDFSQVKIENLDKNSFVYCDPPYFITTGSYNDGTRGFGDWTASSDERLFEFLDKLNAKSIKFGLSNVFVHMGVENKALISWSKKYHVHFITANYNNSNYHSSAKMHDTVEVFITNY